MSFHHINIYRGSVHCRNMKYSETLKINIKNGIMKSYNELPVDVRNLTISQAYKKITDVYDAPFLFIHQIERLVDAGHFDFEDNLPLEKIVKLLEDI